jgi:hypothetical protein
MIVLFDDRYFFDNKIGPSNDLHVKIVLIDIFVPFNLKIVVRFRFYYLATFKSRAKILFGPARVFSQALYSRQKPSLPNLPLFQQIQHFLSLYRPRSVHRKKLSQQKTSKIYPNTSKEKHPHRLERSLGWLNEIGFVLIRLITCFVCFFGCEVKTLPLRCLLVRFSILHTVLVFLDLLLKKFLPFFLVVLNFLFCLLVSIFSFELIWSFCVQNWLLLFLLWFRLCFLRFFSGI